MTCQRKIVALLSVALVLPGMVWATNGYFQHGIGVKEQSLGGAAIAYPQSSLSVATNPASATVIDRRLDLGLDWFRPDRSADNGDGTGYHESDSKNFLIPQLGYTQQINEKLSLALVADANGGMQTDWPKNFFGTTDTYSKLQQMVLAPTLAYSPTPNHSLGLSVNFVRQTFEARGLQAFAPYTPSGTTRYLTNRGEDSSTGVGFRLGYAGQLTPALRIGAFWQPKTEMSKFDDYRELFAHNGELDIPETYGIGVGLKLCEALHVAADLVEIKYGGVPTLGNRNNIGSELLGATDGPGFGWKDITVFKLGVVYRYHPALTLRIGWNHGEQPVRSSQTAINVLATATIKDHLTLGFTWLVSENSEFSMTYWHGFENEIKGDFSAANGADAADIKMHQDNIGIAYSWLFD